MDFARMLGKPLPEVTSAVKNKRPAMAILFIIDGCRADTLYGALAAGRMPNLSRLMREAGCMKFDNCITAFPSVTIACHASIVTGAYPGAHGIVGNDWFIRKKWGLHPKTQADKREELFKATREYVKYSWRHSFSDPGLANGLFTGDYFGIANADMYQEVRTIYEGYNEFIKRDHATDRSMSILEMITRGADATKFIGLDDAHGILGGRVLGVFNWIRNKLTGKAYFPCSNKGLDRRAVEELDDVIDERERKRPELFVVWLPGMDGFTHTNGAGKQPHYLDKESVAADLLVGEMDDQIGRLLHRLKKENLLDKALIVVTADHGQYDCSDRLSLSNEMVYQHLRNDPAVAHGEIFPLTSYGKVDDGCKNASVVVMGNGGACHISIEAAEGWGVRPGLSRIEKFARSLERLPGADKIFVRFSQDEYRLWSDGACRSIDSLNAAEYPFAEERVNNLAATLRSGDILVSAKPPFYFANEAMRGEHGTLRKEDSHVPLLIINGAFRGASSAVSRNVRTIDIAPTIADSMGFLAEFTAAGNEYDKLGSLLDTLQHHLQSAEFKGGLDTLLAKSDQFADVNRIKKNWDVAVKDLRNNFEEKCKAWLKTGQIKDDERYKTLRKRFEGMRG